MESVHRSPVHAPEFGVEETEERWIWGCGDMGIWGIKSRGMISGPSDAIHAVWCKTRETAGCWSSFRERFRSAGAESSRRALARASPLFEEVLVQE